MNTRKLIGALSLGALAVTAGYSISRADSPFASTRAAPIVFSGYLSTSGTPLSGTHQISVNLWAAADTSTGSNEICVGATQPVDVNAGNFQIQVDAACASAFTTHTQVWDQLVVDGTPFPLQQVGAAPFAARSAQEFTNGTRLTFPRSVLYAADGYRGNPGSGPLQDTKRNETCMPTTTSEGLDRCMPPIDGLTSPHLNPAGLFSDSGCTQTLPTTGYVYEYHQYYGQAFTPLPYDGDSDANGHVSAVNTVTGATIQVWQHGASSPCQQALQGGYTVQYTITGTLPLTEFVEVQTVAE